MLVGSGNNLEEFLFKVGDIVYVSNHYNSLYSYTSCYSDNMLETGYGVIVEINSCNEDYPEEYLSSLALLSVLINGKINWYSSNEIFRISSRNSS